MQHYVNETVKYRDINELVTEAISCKLCLSLRYKYPNLKGLGHGLVGMLRTC